MESFACRRRASDAEQSAWSHSMTAERALVKEERAPVKEEPEWGECDESAAAAAEGFYDGHEVKVEVELEPELIQEQDVAFSVQNALSNNTMEEDLVQLKPAGVAGVAPECSHSHPDEFHPCHMGPTQHFIPRSGFLRLERTLVDCMPDSMQGVVTVKEENLHKPKPVNGANTRQGCSHTCPGDGPCCNRSIQQQYGLRRCYVKLEQLAIGDLQINNSVHKSCDKKLSQSLGPCNLKSVHCSVKITAATEQLANSPASPTEYTHKAKRYSCDTCHKWFTFKSQLTKHICYLKKKPYSCNICNKRFAQPGELTRHIHTGEKSYGCDVCNKRFTQKGDLTKHIRIHTGEKPYSCDVCNKRFMQKGDLTRHIRIHTDEKPYGCNVCNKRFSRMSSLNIHLQIHSDEKPYGCDVCKKRFLQKIHLTHHIRIHTNEKPYKCDVCNKWFTKKTDLTRHIRIHTDEKPYSCDVCNKRFVQKNHLTSHIRTHTGEKPYSCDVCNKRFSHKPSLNRHLKIHTDKKPYSCDVCNKRFVKKMVLTRHILNKHR